MLPKSTNTIANNQNAKLVEDLGYIAIYEFKDRNGNEWWVAEEKTNIDKKPYTLSMTGPNESIGMEFVQNMKTGKLFIVRMYYPKSFPYNYVLNPALKSNRKLEREFAKLKKLHDLSGG